MITYEATAPQIHLHYRTSDDLAERQGYGEVELCCHGCGTGVVLRYGFPGTVDHEGKNMILEAVRAFFREEHRTCVDRTGGTLCPPYRRLIGFLDLTRPYHHAPRPGLPASEPRRW